jgi:acyl-coenzyme A synthetase/AMP-(fatty) acid ligase
MDPFKHAIFIARLIENEPAIATIDGVVTYRALVDAVEAVSEVLTTLPIGPKSLVLLDVRNQFNHIVLMLALGLHGVPSGSLQTIMSVETTGVTPDLVLTDVPGAAKAGGRTIEISPTWFQKTEARAPDYAALLSQRGFSGDDLVRVAFSSGTTGFPKAVALRFPKLKQRLMKSAYLSAGVEGFGRTLSMIGPSILGSYLGVLSQFNRGGMLAITNKPDEAVHLTRLFRLGSIGGAVFQLQAILKAMEGQSPLTSVLAVAAVGAKINPRIITEVRSRLSPRFFFGYGTTEAGSISWATANVLEQHPDSCGHLLTGVEMEVVDTEHRPLPPGTTGIIRLKTDEMLEYLNPTPDTAEMFRDGWFYPGDVGSLSAEGIVTLAGRTTEVINRGGAIVAPEYVEEGLRRSVSGITDVGVFGVTNAAGIEEIWAAIVGPAAADPAAVSRAAAGYLADKVPDRVVAVEAIPRGEMGKIRRAILREEALKRTAAPGR